MKCLMAVISILCLSVCACRQTKRLPEGPTITQADMTPVKKSLDEASLVMIGRLKTADFSWQKAAGAIAFNLVSIDFDLVRVLKGNITEKRVRVSMPVFGDKPYFEDEGPNGRGFRLSKSFFIRGSDYIVCATKKRLPPSEEEQLYLVGPLGGGVWIANSKNVAAIEEALRVAK